MKAWALLAIAASTPFAARSAAAEDTPAAEAPATALPLAKTTTAVDRLEAMWRFELAYRGSFVTNAGYNPFSTSDYFPQVSLTASRTLLRSGRWSFATGLGWDYGKTGATARGDASSLEVHRLVVPLEGRAHFGRWGYAFVRAAPGVAMERAEIDDPSAPGPLSRSRWLFATDLSAGYAYPILARIDTAALVPRVWVQSDGGYGWVVEQRLDLAPNLPAGDPRSAAGVDLGTLALQGAFFRIALAASF